MTKPTRKQTLESAGATCAGAVATVAQPLGATQRRGGGNLLSGVATDVPFPNTPFSPKNRKRKAVKEAKKSSQPCWDNYEMVGMKTKNGKKVPNCVPKKSVKESSPYVFGGDNPDAPHSPNRGDAPVSRGDEVLVQDPDNIAAVLSGTVARVGRTMVFVDLKNGDRVAVPHDHVSKDFDVLSKRAHKILNKKGEHVGNYKVTENEQSPYSSYAEQLAQRVFDRNPRLSTAGRSNDLLDAGFAVVSKEYGTSVANNLLSFDEDFPSDFVSAYMELQRSNPQQEFEFGQEDNMTTKIDEISKPALKRYVKAAGKDLIDRASSDSFTSGKAGDKYNKADATEKDTRREKGIDRALDKLGKDQKLEEWSAKLHEELDLLTAKDSPRRKTGLNNKQEEKAATLLKPVASAVKLVKAGLKKLPPEAAQKLLANIETLVTELKASVQQAEGNQARNMVEAAVKTISMMAESVNKKAK